MAKSNNQKGKILYLARLLRDSGEDHVIAMQDILTYLQENGIRAERKSIYDDLEVLRGFGMDVRYQRGRPGGYYLANPDMDWLPGKSGLVSPLAERQENRESEWSQTENEGSPVTGDAETDMVRVLSQIQADDENGRQVKLFILDEAGRKNVQMVFGQEIEFRDKPDGSYTVNVTVQETGIFYGWLTAMGESVQVIKPKKLIQNYRDYLKEISRKYKQLS